MDDDRMSALAERRREERVELLGGDISLTLAHGRWGAVQTITHDMSRSGMAVMSSREIPSDTKVFIQGDAIGTDMRPAVVRWCRRIGDDVFRAGLQFS